VYRNGSDSDRQHPYVGAYRFEEWAISDVEVWRNHRATEPHNIAIRRLLIVTISVNIVTPAAAAAAEA